MPNIRSSLLSIVFTLAVFVLASCGGSSSEAGGQTVNTYSPEISNTRLIRDSDGSSPLLHGNDVRDTNGLVSVAFDVSDIDDEAYGLVPTSSCKTRFGSSGDYALPCDGIDISTAGGSTLETQIMAMDSYGDVSKVTTEYVVYNIDLNDAPVISGVPSTLELNIGEQTNLPGVCEDEEEGVLSLTPTSYVINSPGPQTVTYSCTDGNKTTTKDLEITGVCVSPMVYDASGPFGPRCY